MAATSPIQIGADRWNAPVYASLYTASELAAEFDRPEGESSSDADEARACQFLVELNGFLARGLSLTDHPDAVPAGTPKEKLIAQRDAFLSLYRICERILALSGQIHKLGQMKAELDLLRAQSERVLDVVDWFDALSTPEETEAIFKAAEIERANGEYIPWSEVK
jgi:hypothetical protein